MAKKKTAEILDLAPAICENWLDGLEAKVDNEGLALIDFSGVTRLQLADNDSTQDKLRYTPRTKAQVLHAFKQFGFDTLPRTWGELQGTYEHCLFFRAQWLGSRGTPHEAMIRETAVDSMATSFPEFTEALAAYMANDIELLTKINEKNGLMEELGRDYLEWDDRGPEYGMSKLL